MWVLQWTMTTVGIVHYKPDIITESKMIWRDYLMFSKMWHTVLGQSCLLVSVITAIIKVLKAV